MKKILIVDDDVDVVVSLKAMLQSKGYHVVEAYSGQEGLQAFKENNPDVILLDLMMEHVDTGFTVCREMRRLNANAKIFLLSAVGDEAASSVDIAEAGFNGALSKPISPEELFRLVE